MTCARDISMITDYFKWLDMSSIVKKYEVSRTRVYQILDRYREFDKNFLVELGMEETIAKELHERRTRTSGKRTTQDS